MQTLSRRRRAKKIRLQEGGSMIVSDGQAQRARIEVAIKVKPETSQSGSGELLSRPTQRRCGVCHNVGHNSRTCHVVISSSEEESDG